MAQYDGELKIGASVDTSNVKNNITSLAKSIKSTFSSMTAGAKNSSSAIQGVTNQIEKTTAKIEQLEKEKEKMLKTPIYSDEYKKMQADLDKTNRSIDKSVAKLDTLKAKLEVVGNQKVPTEQYTKLNSDIANTEATIDKLNNKMSIYLDTQSKLGKDAMAIQYDKPFIKLQTQIENATNKLNELKTSRANLEATNAHMTTNKEAFSTGNASAEYNRLAKDVQNYSNNIIIAKDKANQLKSTLEDPAFRSKNVTTGVNIESYEKASSKVDQLKARLGQLYTRYSEIRKSSNTTGQSIKKAFNGVHKVFDNLKNSLSKIASGFGTLKQKISNATRSAAKDGKKNFQDLLRAGLSVRTLYDLFIKLKAYAKDAFGNMAKLVPEFGNQVNELKGNLTQVKNSLATAFQPIVSVIIPILNSLCSVLMTASNALANFFATLTGQKYIYKAGKANNTVAKSIGGVGKAAKEAKKELAAYDKLLVISSDADNGGSGGSGGADTAGMGSFEKVPTEASSLAQQIKDAFNKKDFEGIGKTIGEHLKTALDKIPWSKIRRKANTAGSTFARIINGFIKVPDIGTTIGSSIAQGLTTAWEIVNGFVTTLDWGALGTFIGQSITGFLDTFDWDLAADTLSKLVNGLADAALNVLDEVKKKLPGILTKIGNAVKKFVDEFPADKLGKIVADVINIGVQLIQELLPNISTIGTKLGQFVHTVVTETDWVSIGSMINEGLSQIMQAITNFINEIDPESIGNAISDLVSNIDIVDLIDKLLTLAENIVLALAKALKGVDWAAVGEAIADLLSTIVDHIPDLLAALGTLAWEILKGLGEAILNFAAKNPLGAAITGVLVALKLTGGLSSLGSTIMSTLGTAMSGASSSISGVFSKLFAKAGPIAAVVAAGIAGWEIGKWIDSKIGKYTDVAFETADTLLGGSLSKSRKESARQDEKQKYTKIGIDENAARANIKDATSQAEANKIAQDSYADLEKQIDSLYTGTMADVQKAQSQYKLGLIDEKTYTDLLNKSLKDNEQNKNSLNKLNTEVAITSALANIEEDKLTTSFNNTSDAINKTKDSYNGMPSAAKTAMEQAKKATEDMSTATKKATEESSKSYQDMAKHYEDMYKPKNTDGVTASINSIKSATSNVAKSVSTNTAKMTKDWKSMSKSVNTNMTKAAKDSAKHFTSIYGSAKTNTSKTTKELNSINKNVKLNNFVKNIKNSFSDVQKDSYNKTIKNNDSISKNFNKASTNSTTSFNDSNFTNELNKSFKTTAKNADTNANGDDGISAHFNKSATSSINSFTSKGGFKDKIFGAFNYLNEQAKTQAIGSKGDGSAGIAGKFKSASTMSASWFTNNDEKGFKAKIFGAFNYLNEQAKTQAIGSKGDGSAGIAGKFKSAASKSASWFTDSSDEGFKAKIFGVFKDVSESGAKKYAIGENGDANNTGNSSITGFFGKAIESIKSNFSSAKDSISGDDGIIRSLSNKSIPWIENLAKYYGYAAENIYNNLKGAANNALDDYNSMSNGNSFFSKAFKAVSKIFRGFSATSLSISPLAQGGVIPPNREFLALLGDQKQGVNIETPLDTMVDAFNTALAQNGGGSNNNQPIVLQLDGKVIAQAVWDQNLRRYKQTGNYGFI